MQLALYTIRYEKSEDHNAHLFIDGTWRSEINSLDTDFRHLDGALDARSA